jgi:broad specificity phosphatase PhoE
VSVGVAVVSVPVVRAASVAGAVSARRPAPVKLYVVRHAHAGSRSNWSDDDRLRPLSKKGRRQAKTLAKVLASAGIKRLVSSPSIRCVETLQPLAATTGLPVDDDDRLAEGSDGDAALALADELRRNGVRAAVLCSHGDVIPDLLWRLKNDGATFHHDLTWPKGSIWIVDGNGSQWTDATFVPIPKD